MKKVRIVLWSAVVVAAAVSATLWMTERNQGPVAARVDPEAESFTADFELTDHTGMVQTDEDFRGRWMLVFFGFANCPDVCPMGLATIAQVMDELGAPEAEVVIVDDVDVRPDVSRHHAEQRGAPGQEVEG